MNFFQKKACLLFMTFVFIAVGMGRTKSDYSVVLNEGWFVQSSEKTPAKGEEISRAGFSTASWHAAPVPGTVLGALVGNNVYRDIYMGKNFERISTDPFKGSWWYRTEFPVADDPAHNLFRLQFDGINYRANIWLNGKLVAGADKAAGAFRRFDFDVTGLLKPGTKNALAVEVYPPHPGDLTLGFVDWNPKPPDKNMGLWREVRLIRTGSVSLHFPLVKTRVDLDTLKEARLEISAEVRNNTRTGVSGVLEGRIERVRFSRPVELGPGETKLVLFTPTDTPQLVIENPRLWWSHDFGTPELYDLQLEFRAGGAISDSQRVRFGIREVSDYFNEAGYRGYKLNGKKILIRGGGWVDELLLDSRYKKIEAEVKYARHMNLNTLRLEGFWGENEDLYDLCDENGILLMAGWSCQWEWENYFGKPTDEYGGIKTPEQIKLAGQSWKDQVKWLRNHPSIFVWLMGSDLLPRPALEKEFIRILSVEDPTRPSLISAGGKVSTLTGKSGVKMNGPYDYVPPDYWYLDTKYGGAFGFNTETGPGPQVPLVESLKRFIPAKDLWPVNDVWYYHCARGEFNTLGRYNEAMAKRLGAAANLEEYGLKAQFLNYEGMRAMFEAFAANKFTATGIIQWMYNSAWPKLWWQLYDYYLMPTAAFFGARKACEPLHILYAYGKDEIVVVNSTLSDQHDLRATALVLNFDMTNKFSKEWTVSLAPNEAQTIFTLPDLPGLSPTYFLDLRLFDRDGRPLSSNFYSLSTKPDVLDEAKTEWFVTPVKDYADMTALNGLPPVRLKTGYRFGKEGARDVVAVELENPTSSVAFMVELRLVKDKSGEAVLPIFWEDNYFSLLPREKKTLRGAFAAEDLGGEKPVLKISGWNVK